MAEQWFENEDAQQAMLNSPKLLQAIEELKRLPEGTFTDRIEDPVVVWMEEKTIVEDGVLLNQQQSKTP